MSKTLTILSYDASEEAPTRTFLMLRAWMLWRVQRHGFIGKRVARMRWFAEEERSLKQAIADLQVLGSRTGCAKADAEIAKWMPSVF